MLRFAALFHMMQSTLLKEALISKEQQLFVLICKQLDEDATEEGCELIRGNYSSLVEDAFYL